MYPVVSSDPAVQGRYDHMRRLGESHSIAEILATRKFPGTKGTSSDFMKGTHFQESPLDQFRYAQAKAAGVDTNGKRYLPSLAAYSGDPEAWVSDLSDVKRVVESRGWNCSGAVDHRGYDSAEREPLPDIKVAPDIVDLHIAAELEQYAISERSEKLIGDLRDKAVRKLTGGDEQPLKVADYEDPFALPGMEEE